MPSMSASVFSCPTGHPSGCSGLRVSRKNMPFGRCVWCRRRLRCPPGRQGVSSLYGRARPPHIGRAGGRAGHLARPSLCSGPDTLGCVTPRLLDGSIQVKRGVGFIPCAPPASSLWPRCTAIPPQRGLYRASQKMCRSADAPGSGVAYRADEAGRSPVR
jgi:hypothetical protein